jgi:hypothetical protein
LRLLVLLARIREEKRKKRKEESLKDEKNCSRRAFSRTGFNSEQEIFSGEKTRQTDFIFIFIAGCCLK